MFDWARLGLRSRDFGHFAKLAKHQVGVGACMSMTCYDQ